MLASTLHRLCLSVIPLFIASALALTPAVVAQDDAAWKLPAAGWATMTHYDLPKNWVASCGCVGRVTYHPVAALNRLAYGSNTSFGPACGSCAKLTLISTPLTPLPNAQGTGGDRIEYSAAQQADGDAPSVVVKVMDLCPGLGGPHCNASATGPNALGAYVHFDLAWPSPTGAIPSNFFPGDHDYGVWNVSYSFVPCTQWSGYSDTAALGSEWDQGSSACCPVDPPLPSSARYGATVLQSSVTLLANGLVPQAEQPATCPAYWATRVANPAIVPNTSNPLSIGDSAGAGIGAAAIRGPPVSGVWALPWLAVVLLSAPALVGIAQSC